MNKLDKKAQCPCGKMKRIKWVEAKKFEKGEVSFTAGHSVCPACSTSQVHFSGDARDIQAFIEESGLYGGFELTDVKLDKRSCH
jgi:hypothetical protein